MSIELSDWQKEIHLRPEVAAKLEENLFKSSPKPCSVSEFAKSRSDDHLYTWTRDIFADIATKSERLDVFAALLKLKHDEKFAVLTSCETGQSFSVWAARLILPDKFINDISQRIQTSGGTTALLDFVKLVGENEYFVSGWLAENPSLSDLTVAKILAVEKYARLAYQERLNKKVEVTKSASSRRAEMQAILYTTVKTWGIQQQGFPSFFIQDLIAASRNASTVADLCRWYKLSKTAAENDLIRLCKTNGVDFARVHALILDLLLMYEEYIKPAVTEVDAASSTSKSSSAALLPLASSIKEWGKVNKLDERLVQELEKRCGNLDGLYSWWVNDPKSKEILEMQLSDRGAMNAMKSRFYRAFEYLVGDYERAGGMVKKPFDISTAYIAPSAAPVAAPAPAPAITRDSFSAKLAEGVMFTRAEVVQPSEDPIRHEKPFGMAQSTVSSTKEDNIAPFGIAAPATNSSIVVNAGTNIDSTKAVAPTSNDLVEWLSRYGLSAEVAVLLDDYVTVTSLDKFRMASFSTISLVIDKLKNSSEQNALKRAWDDAIKASQKPDINLNLDPNWLKNKMDGNVKKPIPLWNEDNVKRTPAPASAPTTYDIVEGETLVLGVTGEDWHKVEAGDIEGVAAPAPAPDAEDVEKKPSEMTFLSKDVLPAPALQAEPAPAIEEETLPPPAPTTITEETIEWLTTNSLNEFQPKLLECEIYTLAQLRALTSDQLDSVIGSFKVVPKKRFKKAWDALIAAVAEPIASTTSAKQAPESMETLRLTSKPAEEEPEASEPVQDPEETATFAVLKAQRDMENVYLSSINDNLTDHSSKFSPRALELLKLSKAEHQQRSQLLGKLMVPASKVPGAKDEVAKIQDIHKANPLAQPIQFRDEYANWVMYKDELVRNGGGEIDRKDKVPVMFTPLPPVVTVHSAPTAAGTANAVEGGVADDRWECELCKAKNEQSLEKCGTCSTPKKNAFKWQCKTCFMMCSDKVDKCPSCNTFRYSERYNNHGYRGGGGVYYGGDARYAGGYDHRSGYPRQDDAERNRGSGGSGGSMLGWLWGGDSSGKDSDRARDRDRGDYSGHSAAGTRPPESETAKPQQRPKFTFVKKYYDDHLGVPVNLYLDQNDRFLIAYNDPVAGTLVNKYVSSFP